MRVVLDTNVLVSAALKQKSMPGMAALVVERRGGAPPFTPVEIYYDPSVVGSASEQEVIDALIKAGQR